MADVAQNSASMTPWRGDAAVDRERQSEQRRADRDQCDERGHHELCRVAGGTDDPADDHVRRLPAASPTDGDRDLGRSRRSASVAPMGQLVGVVEKPSGTPGVVRFELNRSLSGMGHERFSVDARRVRSTRRRRWPASCSRTGKVAGVHVYGNMVTVDIEKGYDSAGLADIVREMYRYWKPGVEPPSFDDLPPDEPAAAQSGDAGDGGVELSEAAKRVPAHLLERSRAARERWKAKQGG